LRAAAAALAAGTLLAAAPPADAYRFAGPRWPNQTISVANETPRYAGAVRKAIRVWNRARVGVRFTRVSSTDRARVVFRYASGRGSGVHGCGGVAGGTGAGYPSPYLRMVVFVVRTCGSPAIRRLTAAHELGHVLGLGHEDRRCALMNSSGNTATGLPSHCPGHGPAARRLRRRLTTADDVRGARALYRRAPRAVDQKLALFNPGDGSRLPLGWGPVRFGAAVRNTALGYRWDFGDPASGAANSATGLDATHAYAAPGAYTIRLEVLDGGTVIATGRQRLELF
jgi:PKD domain